MEPPGPAEGLTRWLHPGYEAATRLPLVPDDML